MAAGVLWLQRVSVFAPRYLIFVVDSLHVDLAYGCLVNEGWQRLQRHLQAVLVLLVPRHARQAHDRVDVRSHENALLHLARWLGFPVHTT